MQGTVFEEEEVEDRYGRRQDKLFQKGGEETELNQHWTSCRNNHMVHQQVTIIVKFSFSKSYSVSFCRFLNKDVTKSEV